MSLTKEAVSSLGLGGGGAMESNKNVFRSRPSADHHASSDAIGPSRI